MKQQTITNKIFLFLALALFLSFIIPLASAITVSNCTTISSAGLYTFNQSLTSLGTCITISSSNVDLDINGFSVTGNTTGNAVRTSGTFNNITIRNFNFTNFSQAINYATTNSTIRDGIMTNNQIGIWNTAGTNQTINNVTSDFNSQYGILTQISNVFVINSIFRNNTLNDVFFVGTNVNIRDSIVLNTISGSDDSLKLQFCTNCSVINTTVINNNLITDGIGIVLSTGAYIANNTINTNRFGIDVGSLSTGNTITGNVVTSNSQNGINFGGGTNYNVITGNTFNANIGNGAGLSSSNHNVFSNNNYNNNLQSALSLTSSHNNTFTNEVYNSSGTGFGQVRLTSSQNNTFRSITFTNSGVGNDFTLVGAGNDGTLIIDTVVARYNFAPTTAGSLVGFKTTNVGDIIFTSPINASGTNLANDLIIGSNSAFVNSSKAGLNRSADITLLNLPFFLSPVVGRDGALCSPSVCSSLSVIGNNATFTVTGFSAYSIIEGASQSSQVCQVLVRGFGSFGEFLALIVLAVVMSIVVGMLLMNFGGGGVNPDLTFDRQMLIGGLITLITAAMFLAFGIIIVAKIGNCF